MSIESDVDSLLQATARGNDAAVRAATYVMAVRVLKTIDQLAADTKRIADSLQELTKPKQ